MKRIYYYYYYFLIHKRNSTNRYFSFLITFLNISIIWKLLTCTFGQISQDERIFINNELYSVTHTIKATRFLHICIICKV